MIKTKKMLNANVMAIAEQDLLEQLNEGVLITPNIDHLVKLQYDKGLYEAYSKAEWIVCDSKILYFLYRFTKNSVPQAIPGSSFFTKYYLYHKEDPECRIFLLGAKEGVAEIAKKNINEKCGRKIVVGAHSPSFGFEKNPDEIEEIIKIINESKATTVLVGVGAPKQEKWIIKHKDRMPGVKVWMGLGATIDFESGTLRRAPRFVQSIGMEWLYRAVKDPKRLLKRYFVDDMKFFWYYGKQLLGIYRDPFGKLSNTQTSDIASDTKIGHQPIGTNHF